MTPEQQALIERLYENESLTDNLTDADAQALLKWAAEQIENATDGELVMAAVSNANQSGGEGVQALITQASSFLTKELRARAAASHVAEPTEANGNVITPSAAASSAAVSPHESAAQPEPAAPTPSTFGVQGASGIADAPRAQAHAALAPVENPSAPKRRRAKRAKKT